MQKEIEEKFKASKQQYETINLIKYNFCAIRIRFK
jgi:hypothetical protein